MTGGGAARHTQKSVLVAWPARAQACIAGMTGGERAAHKLIRSRCMQQVQPPQAGLHISREAGLWAALPGLNTGVQISCTA